MRRILVDGARRKQSLKQGGGYTRESLDEGQVAAPKAGDDILALNDGLDRLAETDQVAAELVKLRYFAGMTSEQAARVLGLSARTADRIWVYARSFLLREIEDT
jgi:RNA polymerase sigma factor (TIGR02999 family)